MTNVLCMYIVANTFLARFVVHSTGYIIPCSSKFLWSELFMIQISMMQQGNQYTLIEQSLLMNQCTLCNQNYFLWVMASTVYVQHMANYIVGKNNNIYAYG